MSESFSIFLSFCNIFSNDEIKKNERFKKTHKRQKKKST